MKSTFLILMTFLMVGVVAQERERDGERRGGERRPGDFRGEEMRKRMGGMRMFDRLKKENPEEYERLMKLKEEDPEAFKKALMERMRKRMGDMKGGSHWMDRLKKDKPEEYERLMKLKEEDPAKFREEMMMTFRKKMHDQRSGTGHHDGSFMEIRKLAQQYREASDGEKEDIKNQLRDKLAEFVDKDLKYQAERIKKMEEHLKLMKKQIDERGANKDKYVDEKLEKIINSDFKKPEKGKEGKPGRPDAQNKDFRNRFGPKDGDRQRFKRDKQEKDFN